MRLAPAAGCRTCRPPAAAPADPAPNVGLLAAAGPASPWFRAPSFRHACCCRSAAQPTCALWMLWRRLACRALPSSLVRPHGLGVLVLAAFTWRCRLRLQPRSYPTGEEDGGRKGRKIRRATLPFMQFTSTSSQAAGTRRTFCCERAGAHDWGQPGGAACGSCGCARPLPLAPACWPACAHPKCRPAIALCDPCPAGAATSRASGTLSGTWSRGCREVRHLLLLGLLALLRRRDQRHGEPWHCDATSLCHPRCRAACAAQAEWRCGRGSFTARGRWAAPTCTWDGWGCRSKR